LYCLQHLILNSFLRVCSCQRSSRETEVSFGPSRLDASPRRANCDLT
jgi:hypothetical protein